MYNRFFVTGISRNKVKSYFSTSSISELNKYVRTILSSHNNRTDLTIIDWDEKKQVALLDYAREVLKIDC